MGERPPYNWWHTRKSGFQNGTRYLSGKPVNDLAHLQSVLKTGFQRQRIAAAFSLAMNEPGAPLFEYRARGKRQEVLLGIG